MGGHMRRSVMHPNPRFWSGKQVCVTGGTGFLGWHLVKQLRALGARVRVLGLAPSPDHPLPQLRDVELVLGDIRDSAKVERSVGDCDVVFHTAGTVAVSGPGL